MRTSHLLSTLALALVAVPSLAAAQPAASPPPAGATPYYAPAAPYTAPVAVGPQREGFTAELGLGFGMTIISPKDFDGDTRNGLSGLNVGLGGWISPRTAVTVRIAGTSFKQKDIFGEDVQLIAGMLGVSVQQMVSDVAWVGGGAGIGVLSDDQDSTDPESGFSLDLRAGYNFYQSQRNAFSASLEITPGFFDGGRVTGVGLQLGWQHL
jgi:hypothetical protein